MAGRSQQELVRERFTRTAQQFASFSLTKRSAEAERLAELAAPRADCLAVDFACGPGTFTQALAPRVLRVCGVDLTPALLAQAQHASFEAGQKNVRFVCGDAGAVPLADASVDLAVCGYSFHHFDSPAQVAREMARIVRRGGRVAVVDLILPRPEHEAAHNAIERARDASHVRTHTADELGELLVAAGLRIVAKGPGERVREFDDWMRIAGWGPDDDAYAETLRLLEASMPGDTAGFHPRWVESGGRQRVLEFVQTSYFLVAEK